MSAYDVTRLGSDLVTYASGYLRNPIRRAGLTCTVCTTPLYNSPYHCDRCAADAHMYGADLADAVAPIIYAVGGSQAGFVMRSYKAPQPQSGHVTLVSYLTWFATLKHAGCAGSLAETPVTHWATVPSHPPKPGEHPLRRIVAAAPPAAGEVVLTALTQTVGDPRATARGRFVADVPPRSHVLLVDDTWTTGGHGQSAALALRDAGADRVSTMVVARWINRGYGDNEQFIKTHLTPNYDPTICPWTGGPCP